MKETRLNLLPDNETGRSYCWELTSTINQSAILFSALNKDEFDDWIAFLLPETTQEIPDASDDDIAALSSKFRSKN